MTLRTTAEVLLNGGAGVLSGSDPVPDIARLFSDHGVRANVRLLPDGCQLQAATQQALASRPEVIVAGGGDGTLSTVAGVLAGSGVALGILPLGTLNHFAKDAGIPLGLAAAVETVCRGRVTKVDVGRVNGRVFINNSSLGLYPEVVDKRDELRRQAGHGQLRHGKWPASVWAAFWVFRRFLFLRVRIHLDGEILDRRTPLVFIGNNRYDLEGLRLGSRDRLDEGRLSVYIIRRTGRLGLIALAVQLLLGRVRQSREFESLQAIRIEITTRRRSIRVATDGEVNRLATPLCYEADPGALSIVVP